MSAGDHLFKLPHKPDDAHSVSDFNVVQVRWKPDDQVALGNAADETFPIRSLTDWMWYDAHILVDLKGFAKVLQRCNLNNLPLSVMMVISNKSLYPVILKNCRYLLSAISAQESFWPAGMPISDRHAGWYAQDESDRLEPKTLVFCCAIVFWFSEIYGTMFTNSGHKCQYLAFFRLSSKLVSLNKFHEWSRWPNSLSDECSWRNIP